MRIVSLGTAGATAADGHRDARTSGESGTTRALVAIDPPAPAHGATVPHRRTPAALVAHLIAIAADHPQTRARRRASPADAIAAYRTAAGLPARVAPAPTVTRL